VCIPGCRPHLINIQLLLCRKPSLSRGNGTTIYSNNQLCTIRNKFIMTAGPQAAQFCKRDRVRPGNLGGLDFAPLDT
jgi:hypothetical protein